jgi:teichuronic acid biosynthesis glycosyltransferase TuaC
MEQLIAEPSDDGGLPYPVNTRVLWVHNSPKEQRMFLWDLFGALPSRISVSEVAVPLRPSPKAMWATIQEIRAASVGHDAVHAQFGSLVGFLSAFTGRPFILSLRGTDFYVLPSRTAGAWLEARLRQALTYLACLRADRIVVMSRRMRRELRRWPLLSSKRVTVIIDPIGEEFVERVQCQRLIDAPPFRVFMGSLSAANPVKRTWLVESAVNLCAGAGLPVSLNIVSGVPRSKVREEMLESDLVVLTSTHEGWPNIIKEGLACGLPFVATDVSDLGELCSPETPNRLVEADELDVALAIVDALARRDTGSALADILPEAVGLKHLILYRHVAETTQ